MGVYRRKDTGKWMVDVAIGMPDGSEKRVRRTSPVQTRRGAEAYERELRVSLVAGTFEKQKSIPTLSEFAEEFIGNYARSNNKPSEVASKKVHLEIHLVPRLGKKRLDQIGAREIEAFKAHQLGVRNLHPKTVNNQLTTLRKLLNTAEEWGLLESVPKVKSLKTPPSTFDFLSFDEAPRLVEATTPGLWRTMVIVALDTGLRIGELRALHWDDVDLRARQLRVRRSMWKLQLGSTKSNRGRDVPLNPRALAALKAHRHLRGDLVFCNEDGSPLTEKAVQHALRRACKVAGLRSVQWHALRHTFASHLVMRGQSLKTVQELLGHASITMTMIYAHLGPNVTRDAVDSLLAAAPGESEDVAARWRHEPSAR